MSAGRADVTTVQVFTPYKRSTPPISGYLRELWSRRQFAFEMSRTQLRAQHFNTAFGQVWLVLNPILLSFVYYLLVSIIGGRQGGAVYLAHIMAGLFIFYYFAGCVTGGASSIISGGKLILNTAFPKALLPLSAVLVAFLRFLPTLLVYAVVHTIAGLPWSINMAYGLYSVLMITVFGAGCSMFFATLNLYFRDTRSFLPYMIRIWLYLSPVLYIIDQAPHKFQILKYINPLAPMIGTWGETIVEGDRPTPVLLLAGTIWALVGLIVGAWVFVSREKEFAVRL